MGQIPISPRCIARKTVWVGFSFFCVAVFTLIWRDAYAAGHELIAAVVSAMISGVIGGVITGVAAFAAFRVELRYIRRDVDRNAKAIEELARSTATVRR